MLKTGNKTVVELPRLVEPQTALSVATHREASALRGELEEFIYQVFEQAYDARISTFYPALISIARPDESFAAVAGVRCAKEQLFAEHYLDRPIEQLLLERGAVAPREAIVEVGNLAPASAGQARWLIAALTAYLYGAGFSWVVFTAVPALHNAFQRMGIALITLAEADKGCLPSEEKDSWGRYYEAQPMVYAASIHAGYNVLNQRIDPRLPRLKSLWLQAQQEGRRYAEHQQLDIPHTALLP